MVVLLGYNTKIWTESSHKSIYFGVDNNNSNLLPSLKNVAKRLKHGLITYLSYVYIRHK